MQDDALREELRALRAMLRQLQAEPDPRVAETTPVAAPPLRAGWPIRRTAPPPLH